MIFEVISSSIIGGIYLAAKLKSGEGPTNDHEKIKMIADVVGLKKDGKSIRIHRKYRPKNKHYTEYIYQIPLGLSLDDFKSHIDKFEDGLNNKQTSYFLSLKDLKKIDWKKLRQIKSFKDLPEQFKRIFGEKQLIRKNIEMSYDGMLRIKVYDRSLPNFLAFDDTVWNQCKNWCVPIGETKDGVHFIRLDDGHAVIAGTTRYGKTTFLHLLITTFINLHPGEVEFSLIDLKSGLSFQRYANCKQVINMAEDLPSAHNCFKKIIREMKRRKELFKQLGIEKIQDIKQPLSRHYIIIDEASNLDYRRMELESKKDIEKAKLLYEQCKAWMKMIACESASLGIYLIFSTQYPTAEILDSQVKANTITKICYRLDTGTQSYVVLDHTGAEEITIKGRAIVRTPDGTAQVQSYLLDDKQIEKVIRPHIVIKAREDDEENAPISKDIRETGKDTLIIEPV